MYLHCSRYTSEVFQKRRGVHVIIEGLTFSGGRAKTATSATHSTMIRITIQVYTSLPHITIGVLQGKNRYVATCVRVHGCGIGFDIVAASESIIDIASGFVDIPASNGGIIVASGFVMVLPEPDAAITPVSIDIVMPLSSSTWVPESLEGTGASFEIQS